MIRADHEFVPQENSKFCAVCDHIREVHADNAAYFRRLAAYYRAKGWDVWADEFEDKAREVEESEKDDDREH